MSVRASRGVQASTEETGSVVVVGVLCVTDGAHGAVWVQCPGRVSQQAHGVQLRRAMESIIHIEIISKS